jgi:hypothetical protein
MPLSNHWQNLGTSGKPGVKLWPPIALIRGTPHEKRWSAPQLAPFVARYIVQYLLKPALRLISSGPSEVTQEMDDFDPASARSRVAAVSLVCSSVGKVVPWITQVSFRQQTTPIFVQTRNLRWCCNLNSCPHSSRLMIMARMQQEER